MGTEAEGSSATATEQTPPAAPAEAPAASEAPVAAAPTPTPGSTDEPHSQAQIEVKPVAAAPQPVHAPLAPHLVERISPDLATFLHRDLATLEDHERVILAQAKDRMRHMIQWIETKFGV